MHRDGGGVNVGESDFSRDRFFETLSRIVFMAFQTWGYVALEAILRSRHCVPLVFTHPESSHPYETIWNDSVRELALTHGIPVLERRSANADAKAIVRSVRSKPQHAGVERQRKL